MDDNSGILYVIGFFILIVICAFASGKAENKAYDEGYADAKEYYGNYEEHVDSCDGSCDHVQYEIEDLIYDGQLIRKEDLYDTVRDSDDYYTDDQMQEIYWGAYEEGYEDCYYGYEPAY